jgi:hypothetical protein
MKRILPSVLMFIICMFAAKAVELKYPVFEIPKELLENADAVIRLDEGHFEILSAGKAVSKSKFVITILNKNADFRSGFIEFYDKSDKISRISGKVYNAMGKCIYTINSRDFDDMSAVSDLLYAETRLKRYKPVSTSYPYTVEYDCEKTINGLLSYPNWYFISGYRVSVQKSTYIVDVPDKMGLRYKQVNLDSTPEILNMPQGKRYKWECSNLNALEEEPYSLPITSLVPYIIFGANEFEMEGYTGDMSTWNDFGKWINKLNSGLDELPAETIDMLHDLVKDCKSDLEKIDILYKYMQKKTRYVNISIGIGGWQPFAAKVVDDVSYGDCKALSNYMIAILNVAGIKANYVLVRAGRDASDIMTDFPSQQFNHAIVCIPAESDTIWLECTSPFVPFGYLGTFTDNRHACLVNENGGEIVKTPAYPKDSNLFIHRSSIQVLPDGNAFADQQLIYRSLCYDEVMKFLIEDADQQKRWLYKNIDIPAFIIKNFSYQQGGERYPVAVISQHIELPNYATQTGDRIFIPLKMMDREIPVPRKMDERKSDIYVRRDYVRIDSIRYVIPEGYQIEFMPGGIRTESVFGSYSAKVLQEGKEIVYIRRSERHCGVFPKTEYNNMIEYYRQVAKADNAQLVLVKK